MLDLVDNVAKHLGTDRQYHDLMFSHHTSIAGHYGKFKSFLQAEGKMP